MFAYLLPELRTLSSSLHLFSLNPLSVSKPFLEVYGDSCHWEGAGKFSEVLGEIGGREGGPRAEVPVLGPAFIHFLNCDVGATSV